MKLNRLTAVLNTFQEEGHIAAIEEMFKINEKYGDSCYMKDYYSGEDKFILGRFYIGII